MTGDYEPRRAEPEAEFSWSDRETGKTMTMKADEEGIVRPRNAAEQSLADSYELPVARKVIEEERAAEPEPKAAAAKKGGDR